MDIKKIFIQDSLELNKDIKDTDEVLREIATLACKNPILQYVSQDKLFKLLKEREELGSTALYNGIAFPHCSINGIDDFVIGILTLKDGIPFNSIDKNPTRIFTFIIGPHTRRNLHIKILSRIAKIFENKDFREKIHHSENIDSIYSLFQENIQLPADEIPKEITYSQIFIFVQKEELFERTIKYLSDLEGAYFAVFEANYLNKYYNTIPLFVSFWSDVENKFLRVITGIVPQGNLNNILREIGSISENKEKGLLVFSYDIHYLNGELEV